MTFIKKGEKIFAKYSTQNQTIRNCQICWLNSCEKIIKVSVSLFFFVLLFIAFSTHVKLDTPHFVIFKWKN